MSVDAGEFPSMLRAGESDIRDVMDFYDTSGDGKITVDQIGTCLRALGLAPTEQQLKEVTIKWENKETRITLEEFTPIYRDLKKVCISKSPEALSECLSSFDRDGSGLISIHDLRFILTTCGEKLSATETDILLQGQENSDGKVNILEFIRLIAN